MGATALIHQQQYRWKNDTGDETSTDWAAALNTSITNVAINAKKRIRIQLSTGIGAAPSITPRLRFSKDGGAYTELTTGTSDVRAAASAEAGYVDETNTTEQLAGSLTFAVGKTCEDGVASGHTFAAEQDREFEYVVEFLTAGTYDFRVYHDGAGPIDTYPVTAQAVVAAAASSSRNRAAALRPIGILR